MDCSINSDSPFNCIIFDLDDTLYSSKLGIAQALQRNIEDFLVEIMGFSENRASSLRVELFKTYGSTLAGLRVLGYDIDADDYHNFVHGRLPYELIEPNSVLRNLLLSIAQRKIIFTNSDMKHAIRVLKRLGLQDCFDQMICFETMNPNLSKSTRLDEFPVLLKPSLDAMKMAIRIADVDPHHTLFLDDNVRNVAAAKALGIHTVLVGKTVKICNEADYVLDNVNKLPKVIPQIWKSAIKGDDSALCGHSRNEIESALEITVVGA